MRSDKAFVIDRVLQQECEQINEQAELSNATKDILLNFSWPGNIRQLRNALRFALAVCDGGYVEPHHLPAELQPGESQNPINPLAQPSDTLLPSDLSDGLQQAQRLLLTLRKHHWNVTASALELGLCRATLYRQMKRYNIVPPTHQ